VELVEDAKYGTIQYIDYRGKLERAAVYVDSVLTVLDAATYLNALRADSVQKISTAPNNISLGRRIESPTGDCSRWSPNAPEST